MCSHMYSYTYTHMTFIFLGIHTDMFMYACLCTHTGEHIHTCMSTHALIHARRGTSLSVKIIF